MTLDSLLRFDAGGTSRNIQTSLSDNYFDVGTALRKLGQGRNPYFQFACTEAVAGPDGMTCELQIVLNPAVAPVRTSATVTMTNANDLVVWASHGLKVATPFVITGAGTTGTGSTKGVTYYVIPFDANSFQLAASEALALAGTAVVLSADSTGALTATAWPNALANVITCTNATELINWTAHGLNAGTPVRIVLGVSGVIPTGFTAGKTYFVTNPTTNTFQLALTLADALLGNGTGIRINTGAGTTTSLAVLISDDGTAVLNMAAQPCVIGSSGPIVKELLTAKSLIHVPMGIPLVTGSTAGALKFPGHQYLYARMIMSNVAPTAGKFVIDFIDKPGEGHTHLPSGFVLL